MEQVKFFTERIKGDTGIQSKKLDGEKKELSELQASKAKANYKKRLQELQLNHKERNSRYNEALYLLNGLAQN